MRQFDSQITFFRVADLERSTRFYGGLLDLPLVLDQGVCRIFRVSPGAFLGVCTGESAPGPGGVILTLVTGDVDGWHERLAAAGVEFEKPPAGNAEFRIYHCFLRDPDGHLVEIQRFDDPRWAP